MRDTSAMERLDRHALVMAIWCPPAFFALALLQYGLTSGEAWWIAAGFVPIHGAFFGHVIANAILKTGFTVAETALGAFTFTLAVMALLVINLVGDNEFVTEIFLPAGIGIFTLLLAVVIYLVFRFGARGAFERFDVVRDNNLRSASWLPHRGGRR